MGRRSRRVARQQEAEQPAPVKTGSAVCPVCEHEYPRRRLTRHHLVPKSRRGRVTVLLCRPCHQQVHAVLSEKSLEREYGTLEQLLDAPELQSWIGWIRGRRPTKQFQTRRSKSRR